MTGFILSPKGDKIREKLTSETEWRRVSQEGCQTSFRLCLDKFLLPNYLKFPVVGTIISTREQ